MPTSLIDYHAGRVEQARVLLQTVKKYGHLGGPLSHLPATLNSLLGTYDNAVSTEHLLKYLHSKGITSADLGGAITALPKARYFVIHDTSSPYLGNQPFPPNINEPEWSGNNFSGPLQHKVTHVYVNRVGESATVYDFTHSVIGTKYGQHHPAERRTFVHIELIQPRRRDPDGGAKNDAIAPQPGFSTSQLRRLALLYITASTRHGQWLIPAFHCPVDSGYDAHDDPQNFDLTQWDALIGELLDAVKTV